MSKKSGFIFALSFLLPVLIQSAVFFIVMRYPLDGSLVFQNSFEAQFYPFLSDFISRVKLGKSLVWSWTAGGGTSYIRFFAHYLANPLNLLPIFLPAAWLKNVILFFILLKIGLAGLFMSLYLSFAYEKKDVSLPVFATFYALSAFSLCYYWNTMWLDAFALLPLCMLGLLSFIREGKYKLYVITLAVTILTNFALGINICIFLIISFFGQCIVLKLKRQDILRKFFQIAGLTCISICLTGAVLFPAYLDSSSGWAIDGIRTFHSFNFVFGNFIAFSWSTYLLLLPNLYSGVLCVLLVGAFLGSFRIPFREKAVFAVTFFFLILSINVNIFYFIINAFYNMQDLQQKHIFLISFTVVCAAYRTFVLIKDDIKRNDLLFMGIIAAVLVYISYGGYQAIFAIPNALLCLIYIILLTLFAFSNSISGKARLRMKVVTGGALLITAITEIGMSSESLLDTYMMSSGEYPVKYAEVQQLLDMRDKNEAFYRTELIEGTLYRGGSNDPLMYGYNGISYYSSSTDMDYASFMRELGLRSTSNSYGYAETSPLSNLLLNIRYLVSLDGNPVDNDLYWQQAGETGGVKLMENKYYLPLGFMVNRETANYAPDSLSAGNNPFANQNAFFRLATGSDSELFTMLYTRLNTQTQNYEDGTFVYNYEMPRDGMLYAYLYSIKTAAIDISAAGKTPRQVEITPGSAPAYIFTAGSFKKGDIVTFTVNIPSYDIGSDTVNLRVGLIDSERFLTGYNRFAGETLRLTEFTDTRVKGDITVRNDGILYTSIPYKNHWKAYVDGKEAKIIPIAKVMAGLQLTKGDHTIEFRHYDNTLTDGIYTSVISLAAFAGVIIVDRRKKKTKTV